MEARPTSPLEDSGAHVSQRFHFKPYTPVSTDDHDDEVARHDGPLPAPVSQPLSRSPKGGGGGGGPGHVTAWIPFACLLVVRWITLRWKTIVAVVTFGTVCALVLFHMQRPEWREMAYYRVDPNARVPRDAHGAIVSEAPRHRTFPPQFDRCPGPHGKLVPLSPLQAHPTPPTHPQPIVGKFELVGLDGSQCITYAERYSMYTDEALGITYRLPDELLPRTKALFDEDPDDPRAMREQQRPDVREARERLGYDPLHGLPYPEHMPTREYEELLRTRLMHANARRPDEAFAPDWRALMDACYAQRGAANRTSSPHEYLTNPAMKRTAIVMRAYEGYPWREDDILNLRAMISELSLNNPQTPYDVRILVEVKDPNLSVFTSEWDRYRVLASSVPREFWGLVELWSEKQLEVLYAGLPGKFINNMIAQTSYRACLMALQKFWLDHQEYDYVYNWEMDVRYIGNYLDFFEGIEAYARREPLAPGMLKYDTWYMPGVPASEQIWMSDDARDTTKVGEEADLITLGPIFDPRGSGWYWTHDVQNYPLGWDTHRRASIGTNMRMSRGLLEAMNVVNAEAKKSLHCEAWPTTLVLHSQLPPSHNHSFYPEAGFTYSLPLPFKGVFAPHPIYFRHDWDRLELHQLLNRPDFYEKRYENLHKDSSFYYHAQHAKELYMGWKRHADVCRAPSMLHPIKRVD